MQFSPLTARELVESRDCVGACLVALDDPMDCTCRCGGDWHGCLAHAEVPAAGRIPRPTPWHERAVGDPQEYLDEQCPVVANSTAAFNRAYRQAKRDDLPVVVAQKTAHGWTIKGDAITSLRLLQLSPPDLDTWKRLLHALLDRKRLRRAFAGSKLTHLYGVASQREAQVLGVLFRKLLVTNDAGALSALTALGVTGVVHPQGAAPQ